MLFQELVTINLTLFLVSMNSWCLYSKFGIRGSPLDIEVDGLQSTEDIACCDLMHELGSMMAEISVL